MCTWMRLRFNCRKKYNHVEYRLECYDGPDCLAKAGLELPDWGDRPETCMDTGHVVVDPHLYALVKMRQHEEEKGKRGREKGKEQVGGDAPGLSDNQKGKQRAP